MAAGTWTTVWINELTSPASYKERCSHVELVAKKKKINYIIASVAQPLDQESSATNMFASVVDNVFGFKSLRAVPLEDLPQKYVQKGVERS